MRVGSMTWPAVNATSADTLPRRWGPARYRRCFRGGPGGVRPGEATGLNPWTESPRPEAPLRGGEAQRALRCRTYFSERVAGVFFSGGRLDPVVEAAVPGSCHSAIDFRSSAVLSSL